MHEIRPKEELAPFCAGTAIFFEVIGSADTLVRFSQLIRCNETVRGRSWLMEAQ